MFLSLLAGLGTGLALIVAIGAQNAFLLRLAVSARGRVVAAAVLVCAASDAVLILAGVLGVGAVVERFPVALVVVRFIGAAFLVTYGVLAARRALRRTDEALVPDDERAAVATTEVERAAASTTAASTTAASGTASTTTAATTMASTAGAATSPAAAAAAPGEPTTRPTRADRTSRTVPPGRPATMGAALATVLLLTWANPHVYLDTLVFLGSVANQQGPADRWPWTIGAILASCTWFAAVGFGGRLLRPLFARPGTWRVFDGLVAVVMLGFGIALVVGA